MSEFDFEKLKNIEIPDTWVSGALNVPQKTPVVLIFVKKVLPIVASLVLILVLGFFVFFVTRNEENTVATLPHNTTMNTSVDSATQPTEEKDLSVNHEHSTDANENSSQNPTEDKTEFSNDKESESVTKPTQKPTQKPISAPALTPTTKPNGAPSNPGSFPTDNPNDTPNGGPNESPPVDIPGTPADSVIMIGEFDKSLLKGSTDVYISIKKLQTGNLEVDGDRWEQNIPKYPVHTLDINDSTVHVNFYPTLDGIIKESGTYYYCFYNHKGEVVYTGMKYIEV